MKLESGKTGGVRVLDTLRPRVYVRSIHALSAEFFIARRIRAVLTDLDNTLVGWNHPIAPAELCDWLECLRAAGLKVCIVSNNDEHRVESFAAALGIPCVANAHKPRRRGFVQAMATLEAGPEETAMIGDQLFTDIAGGNRAGLFTILVQPVHPREFIGTRALRKVERRVLHALNLPMHDERRGHD
ncbi:MAG: YqeG family HAD IIIA-type phosphatase [Firmicutes bacterium]|nr:YqeG family HAD IIIA-type phosphatase [Bacillota bacterium]